MGGHSIDICEMASKTRLLQLELPLHVVLGEEQAEDDGGRAGWEVGELAQKLGDPAEKDICWCRLGDGMTRFAGGNGGDFA